MLKFDRLSQEEKNFYMSHQLAYEKLVNMESTLYNEEMTKEELQQFKNTYRTLKEEYDRNEDKFWEIYDKVVNYTLTINHDC